MAQRDTVVGTLSGVDLEAQIREFWLGKARLFWNPALSSQQSVAECEIGPNVDIWQDNAHSLPPARTAKLLIDVEIETETGEIQGCHIREELERAVLPLRLGTKGRILVSWAKVGAGSRDTVSSEGIRVAAPELFGESAIVTLDQRSCASLQEFSRMIDTARLDTFEVPIGIFSDSFYRTRAVDRGIDLLVALEALLSEGPESISMKVALRAACFLEAEAQKRKHIFGIVKEAYTHRNTLVHGKRSRRPRAEEWFATTNDGLEDIVRKVLSALVVLSNKGIKLSPEKVDNYLFDSGLLGTTAVPVSSFEAVGRLSRFWRLL
jgi:hypothetical protein